MRDISQGRVNLPDGKYRGEQGGHDVRVYGTVVGPVVFRVSDGIRCPRCPVLIEVKNKIGYVEVLSYDETLLEDE